jgi:catechol 2,3-dioxygenase-like lactoylglutathione lyase family enzyme
MLKTCSIIAFVPTTSSARAKDFYANVLGLHLVSEDAFALVFDAGGTMLRVASVPQLQPAGHTVLGWIVTNIRNAVGELSRKGITFQRYPGLAQDDEGIWSAPGGAQVAWFQDPDGNILSVTEFERSTKRREPVRSKSSKSHRHGARSRRGR